MQELIMQALEPELYKSCSDVEKQSKHLEYQCTWQLTNANFTNKLYTYITRGRFENTYELVNLGARQFIFINKLRIFQCMGKIFCVEFQWGPLRFHKKYLTHTLKKTIFIQYWKFKSSQIYELVNVFETSTRCSDPNKGCLVAIRSIGV